MSVQLLSQVVMGSMSSEIITNKLDQLSRYGKGKAFLPGRGGMKSLNTFIAFDEGERFLIVTSRSDAKSI